MELNKKIVKKYNKLLRETADYYGISGLSLIVMPSSNLLYPYTWDWDEDDSSSVIRKMAKLRKKHPHMVPFYKVFISVYFEVYKNYYITDNTFNEINGVVQKIRKEKK